MTLIFTTQNTIRVQSVFHPWLSNPLPIPPWRSWRHGSSESFFQAQVESGVENRWKQLSTRPTRNCRNRRQNRTPAWSEVEFPFHPQKFGVENGKWNGHPLGARRLDPSHPTGNWHMLTASHMDHESTKTRKDLQKPSVSCFRDPKTLRTCIPPDGKTADVN
jgi:hypothetical protein